MGISGKQGFNKKIVDKDLRLNNQVLYLKKENKIKNPFFRFCIDLLLTIWYNNFN